MALNLANSLLVGRISAQSRYVIPRLAVLPYIYTQFEICALYLTFLYIYQWFFFLELPMVECPILNSDYEPNLAFQFFDRQGKFVWTKCNSSEPIVE